MSNNKIQKENPQKKTSFWEGIIDKIKPLGTLRDGLLVSATFIYLIGYFVLAYYSKRHNLGMLPALEFHYLIAGIVPTFFILLVISIIKGLQILRSNLWNIKFPEESIRQRKKLYYTIGIIILIVFVVIIPIGKVEWVQRTFPELSDLMATYLGIIFIIYLYFLPFRDERMFLRRFSVAYMYLFLTAMTLAGIFTFIEEIYPRIPQEFGGLKPRCAQLDLIRSELSNQTKKIFLKNDSLTTKVAHSIKVDVCYIRGDYILIKPHSLKKSDEEFVYDIKKSIIASINWCGEEVATNTK